MFGGVLLEDEYLSLASYAGAVTTATHHADKNQLKAIDVYGLGQTSLLFGRLAKRQAQGEQPCMAFLAAKSLNWPGTTLNTTEEACDFFGVLSEHIDLLWAHPEDKDNIKTLQMLFKGLGEQARGAARSLNYDDPS
jgi:hypothetical protein